LIIEYQDITGATGATGAIEGHHGEFVDGLAA
jgi:hypothetical protein